MYIDLIVAKRSDHVHNIDDVQVGVHAANVPGLVGQRDAHEPRTALAEPETVVVVRGGVDVNTVWTTNKKACIARV
jgi:hypothetical protein